MRNKLIFPLCVLICVLCLICGALAAQTYSNMMELYQHWETTQTPDWVCSVVSADGTSERLAVVVSSQAAADELAAMVEDASSLDIIVADGSYGYNELLRVQDEISREHMGADGKGPVVSIATGLADIDGQIVGFGESGKELRVVVGILPEYVEEYRNRFQKEYGDMVYVEVSEGASFRADVAISKTPLQRYAGYILGGAVLCLGVLGAAFWLHRKKAAVSEK